MESGVSAGGSPNPRGYPLYHAARGRRFPGSGGNVDGNFTRTGFAGGRIHGPPGGNGASAGKFAGSGYGGDSFIGSA